MHIFQILTAVALGTTFVYANEGTAPCDRDTLAGLFQRHLPTLNTAGKPPISFDNEFRKPVAECAGVWDGGIVFLGSSKGPLHPPKRAEGVPQALLFLTKSRLARDQRLGILYDNGKFLAFDTRRKIVEVLQHPDTEELVVLSYDKTQKPLDSARGVVRIGTQEFPSKLSRDLENKNGSGERLVAEHSFRDETMKEKFSLTITEGDAAAKWLVNKARKPRDVRRLYSTIGDQDPRPSEDRPKPAVTFGKCAPEKIAELLAQASPFLENPERVRTETAQFEADHLSQIAPCFKNTVAALQLPPIDKKLPSYWMPQQGVYGRSRSVVLVPREGSTIQQLLILGDDGSWLMADVKGLDFDVIVHPRTGEPVVMAYRPSEEPRRAVFAAWGTTELKAVQYRPTKAFIQLKGHGVEQYNLMNFENEHFARIRWVTGSQAEKVPTAAWEDSRGKLTTGFFYQRRWPKRFQKDIEIKG